MAFTPCPCMDLQKGVKILAIVDIVLCCIALVLTAFGLVAILSVVSNADDQPSLQVTLDKDDYRSQISYQNDLAKAQHTATTLVVVFAVIFLILIALQLLLAITLYTGASKRLYKRCQVWLIITIILTCLNTLALISGSNVVPVLVRIVYAIYEIIVVVYFLKELKPENSSGSYPN